MQLELTFPQEAKRLSAQNAAVLERLRQGPATNWELAQIALKYTSRISAARKLGYRISAKHLHGGTWEYRLDE